MSVPANMRGDYPPQITTPDFWPADEVAYRNQLDRCLYATVETIGRSAGGREIWGVSCQRREGAPTLAVCGGMHGHESQGPAACFNLIHILQFGKDLKRRRWQFPDINYVVVPVINPDARARVPNAFVGLSVQDVKNYDAGLLHNGERNDSRGDVNPADMLILGGLFNDAGIHVNRHPDPADNASPEIAAVARFISRTAPDMVLETHAHCAPPQFYCPFGDLPDEVQARQNAVCLAVIARGAEEGWDFAPNTGAVHGLSTNIYHTVAGALPILFESPQGTLDAGPRLNHEQIIDVNLFVIQTLAHIVAGDLPMN